jgi:hypothetical protein
LTFFGAPGLLLHNVDRAVAGQPIDIRSALLLEVVSKLQIAPEIKAWANEKAQHT